MRILAIRGANLASLAYSPANPFAIDLTAEPLASAGLFAITGDTGAGKSTILDALCLALYGTFPRASLTRRDEQITDPGGKAITVSDPRNILRRGAAQGFAEVDFIGQDGLAYTARWEVRRARGKADGSLQNPDRRLDLLDRSATIATGSTPVLAAVEARTGFTFDQFKRTVLLAQGEFDAFLSAPDGDRADLLEKITGLDIYARIGTRTFDETAQRKAKLETLTQGRDLIAPLGEPARTALQAEFGETQAAHARHSQIGSQLTLAIVRIEAVTAATQNVAEACTLHTRALAAHTAAEPDRFRALVLERLAPVRTLADHVTQRQTETSVLAKTFAEAQAALTWAEQNAASAVAEFTRTENAARLAATDISASEPIWAQAASLDQTIAAQRQAIAVASQAVDTARAEVAAAQSALNTTREHLASLRSQAETVTAGIARTAPHAQLLANADLIARTLAARRDLADRLHTVNLRRTTATAAIATLEPAIAAHTVAASEARSQRQALEKALADARARRAALNPAATAAREDLFARLHQSLVPTRELADRHVSLTADAAQLARDITACENARADADARLKSASTRLGEHERARADILPLAELASASLSEAAARLRSALVADQPCPVCGSPDHPSSHDDSAASQLAHDIHARRDALTRRIAATQTLVRSAEHDLARANATTESLARAHTTLHAKLASVASAWTDRDPALSTLLGEAGLTCHLGLIQAPLRETSATALATLAAEVDHARSHLSFTRATLTGLSATIEALQLDVESVSRTLDSHTAAIAAGQLPLASAKSDLAEASSLATELTRQLAAHSTDLAPHLTAAGLSIDALDCDPTSVEARLHQLVTDHKALLAAHADLSQDIARHEAILGQTAFQADAARTTFEATQAAFARQQEALAPLIADRAGLLQGEAVATHQRRLKEAAHLAASVLDTARAAQTAAASAHAAANAHHDAAQHALASAHTLTAQAQADLATATADLGHTASTLADLLAVPQVESADLRLRLQRLDSDLAAASSTLAIRQRDLDTLLSTGEPTPSAELAPTELARLHTARDAAAAQRDAATARAAEITHALRADDDARTRTATLDATITAARADLTVWQDLNAAIGQRDGALFRRFAQSVTLAELLALANRQLAALNPRYALQQGKLSDLALEIIDRDMVAEVRSTRSLSGGERFLVSLALALALSELEGRTSFVDTLFIDEGFGALDRETLDVAIDALERLHSQGRKVGVITHVAAMIERIAVQVRVAKRGNGRSEIRVSP